MIHPSYVELMRVVNDDVVIGEEPVVNSRYSIVCATAKRARQLIDGSEPLHTNASVYGKKPLSIAVEELYDGELKLLTAEESEEQHVLLTRLREKNKIVRERRKEVEAAQHAQEASEEEAITTDEEEAFDEEEVADVDEEAVFDEKADEKEPLEDAAVEDESFEDEDRTDFADEEE